MDDLDLIRSAALEAGALALALREDKLEIWAKEGGSPVTDADLKVDRLLMDRLRTARPDYGWLSEETVDDRSRLSHQRVFVVDPIDGTVAYMKQRPWFSVSIAVVEDGRPLAGVVHAPAVVETYEATADGPALVNGVPIRCSDRDVLEGAMVLGDARVLAPPAWPEMLVENRNSLAYRVCLVAAGAFDAAIALTGKSDWDLAAADLIANRAGAEVTDGAGQPYRYNLASADKAGVVCAPRRLHQLILERIAPNHAAN
ncbi:MAG: 3'(2'),5'-bisphosphate nucleotidase CysQ [Caulobacteraceae bacterium]